MTTGVHATVTTGISATSTAMLYHYSSDWMILVGGITVWALIFALMLVPFGLTQLYVLMLKNMTTNEEMRTKWNGSPTNKKAVEIYRRDSSCFAKIRWLCCTKPAPSRLHKLTKLIELYEQRFSIRDDMVSLQTSLSNSTVQVDKGRKDILQNN